MDFASIKKHEDIICGLFEDAECHFSVSEHEGLVCINDYVALLVYDIESSLLTSNDIDIVRSCGEIIATLCPVKNSTNTIKLKELNHAQLIAFLYDADNDQLGLIDEHTFKNNYLIINKSHYRSYLTEHSESSGLWGGFSHTEKKEKYKKNKTSITLPNTLSIPTAKHKRDLARAVSASDGFERFLKYYHQLELLFDVIFVSKIRELPKDSIEGFSEVVKEYNKNELDSIKNILLSYINDTTSLLNIILNSTNHMHVMKSIFQDSSKSGNPLTDNDKWIKLTTFLNGAKHDTEEAFKLKLISKNQEDFFRAYILNLTSYWIYRIRCSIAHNKIGEFMFSDLHEEFVVEVGENLITQVLKDLFSNSVLQKTLSA